MLETVVGGIVMVMTIILTIVLWSLFHKFVTRIYFGGLNNMILTIIFELIGCAIVAGYISVAIVGLIITALKGIGSILSFIFGLILMLLKIGLVVAAVGGIIYLIVKLVRSRKTKTDITDDEEEIIYSNDILTCPNCGKQYKEGDIFCEDCGFKLHDLINKEETKTDNICPYCGNKISKEDLFCQFCGEKLISEEVKTNDDGAIVL